MIISLIVVISASIVAGIIAGSALETGWDRQSVRWFSINLVLVFVNSALILINK